MNISDLVAHFKDKSGLQKMIDKLGNKETARRLAWLQDETADKVEVLMKQFLADDYYDDKGVKGGKYFWGDEWKHLH